MIQETETEVITALTRMKNSVGGWTSELYGNILNHLYILLIILLVVLTLFLVNRFYTHFYLKRIKKYKIISTNKWFDWQEFKAYEKNKKNNT